MSEKLGTHEYVPSMKSSYKCMFAIIALFVVVLLLSFVKSIEAHHEYLLGMWILWILATTALLLYMKAKTLGERLRLKPDEVEYIKGIFRQKSKEIKYKDIKLIEVEQTVMQRLLNIGDLSIASAGTSDKEIEVKNMPSPREVRDEIQARQDALQNVAPAAPAAENQA